MASSVLRASVSGTAGRRRLIDSYNSKPPATRKKNDVGLFTGINVKFGAI